MARIRTIKPEFFTSEDIAGLSPLARLLYIALWCEADREGRLIWKPKTFKLRYLPADECDVEELCAELLRQGLVMTYGSGLAYIPSFSDHQHVNPREAASTLPVPDASPRVRTRRHASNLDLPTQVGKERKGKEGKEHARVDDALFSSFWNAYPRKAAKQDALKAFEKLSPDSDLVARMVAALAIQSASESWTKDGGKFIPHPATWINGKRWTDDEGTAPAGEHPWFEGAI